VLSEVSYIVHRDESRVESTWGNAMRLFDAYIAVDWSAKADRTREEPIKDAIWVGEHFVDKGGRPHAVSEVYCRTRHCAERHVRSRLQFHLEAQRRVFLGFDFPYGYPAGFAAALNLADTKPPWRQVWEKFARLVRDDEKNANNRFIVASDLNARCGELKPGPFWGHDGKDYPSLMRKKSKFGYPYIVEPNLRLDYFRHVEKRIRESKSARQIFSVWQLFGAGSVGGQCIVGIPVVCRLRDDPVLASLSRVWPFETGFTTSPTPEKGPFVLHVEIWPGIKSVKDDTKEILRLDPSVWIPDQAQVRAVVSWLSRLDEEGQLGTLFDIPPSLPPEALKACLDEEGWIIGVR